MGDVLEFGVRAGHVDRFAGAGGDDSDRDERRGDGGDARRDVPAGLATLDREEIAHVAPVWFNWRRRVLPHELPDRRTCGG